jgi:hypothetical protein
MDESWDDDEQTTLDVSIFITNKQLIVKRRNKN